MHANNIHTFLSIHNGTPIKLEADSVDYIFTSRVIGMHRQWLIVDYDAAMEGFSDILRPGVRLSVRFYRDGIFYRFTALWKRYIPDPKPTIILGDPSPLENVERRKLLRIPCDFPGEMEVKRNIEMVVVNINEKGCRVCFSSISTNINDFRKGDHVKLIIKIADQRRSFVVEGEIRDCQPADNGIEAGIFFYDPPNALIAYLKMLKNDNDLKIDGQQSRLSSE